MGFVMVPSLYKYSAPLDCTVLKVLNSALVLLQICLNSPYLLLVCLRPK